MTRARAGSKFSAPESALGYLFQCRYALLASLRACQADENFRVALEALDDVTFHGDAGRAALFQTKHHIHRQADLTDASSDLWKTLRVWCEAVSTGSLPSDVLCYLVTTAHAPDRSAASFLRHEGRDIDRAISLLSSVSQSSTSQANRDAYVAFNTLSREARAGLFSRIFVLDGTPNAADLESDFRRQLYWVVQRRFFSAFFRRLEGWWFQCVMDQLQRRRTSISRDEVEAEINDLRGQFAPDALPIDRDVLTTAIDGTMYRDRPFVHQLRLIGIRNHRLLLAIREYFRASEQRSRWVREDLLHISELDRYERRLVEEWHIHFETMKEELGERAAERAKGRAARELYKWAEQVANVPIRDRCAEPFVTRGSFHILADASRIGWHPDYLERLRLLLEGVTGS